MPAVGTVNCRLCWKIGWGTSSKSIPSKPFMQPDWILFQSGFFYFDLFLFKFKYILIRIFSDLNLTHTDASRTDAKTFSQSNGNGLFCHVLHLCDTMYAFALKSLKWPFTAHYVDVFGWTSIGSLVFVHKSAHPQMPMPIYASYLGQHPIPPPYDAPKQSE